MVFAFEGAGDLRIREGEFGFHEIHGDLARDENVFFAAFAGKFGEGEVEVVGGGFKDIVRGGARAAGGRVLEFGF